MTLAPAFDMEPVPDDEPRRLYAWDIHTGDGDGAAGVTDDLGRAIRYVNEELRSGAPDASGTVRRVRPQMSGRGPYLELGTEAEARIDAATGAVVWT